MQSVSAALLTELNKGLTEPRVLVDLLELYSNDYVPPAGGPDPADAEETFAAQEITWDGIAYRREVVSRGDITRNMGEKTNSVTIQFSNISRYLATLAQAQTIEGMILVIRCVSPSVTDDSIVLFVGRCDKPSDIDKKTFTLTARQDFGNINQSLPPRKFTPDDPDGRLPGDPLYEGIQFNAIDGSFRYPVVVQAGGFAGRILGRRKTETRSLQWSSADATPYGSAVPEVLGRCQMQLIPIAQADKGVFVSFLMVACAGPIAAIDNVRTKTEGLSDPLCTFASSAESSVKHLGDLGGTGTNQGNTCQADLGGGQVFSHLAYIEGASIPLEYFRDPTFSDPELMNEPPVVVALIKGRIVELPDGTGEYTIEGWTDNPVHIARFILTSPDWVNINEGFMEDAVNYQTSLICDEPIFDETNDQIILIPNTDLPQAGTTFTRNRSTGILTSSWWRHAVFGDAVPDPEITDGPYTGIDPSFTPNIAIERLLRKRYTCSVPITDDVRAVDFLYKTIFPTAKLYLRINKKGRYEIRSEVPSDQTHLRSATAVGAASIPILDVTPWKSGPDLLLGRLLLGFGLETAEVRDILSADYSTSGNSITLTASAGGGGVTATASGATLSGGSTSVQASGTVTIGGAPAAGNTVTVTINGIAITYTLDSNDTTGTVALMVKSYINATPRLRQFVKAEWSDASPNVVTIKCLHGALNVSSAYLKAHSGPVADPTTAPTVASSAGGTLPAGTYKAVYADANALGSTALTAIASITVAEDEKIDFSSLPALPAGITERRFYISEKAGSTNLRYSVTRTDANSFSITAVPSPGAAFPPSKNTTAEELLRVAMSFATNSQDVFPAWRASTMIALNDVYLPTVLNGHKYEATSITTGITGSTEPTWPTTAGGTVVDGGVTWTEIGSTVLQQAGLTRANIKKDGFKWPLGSTQSSVNQVKGSYRDPKNDFALTPYRVNDPTHQAQVKKIYPLEFDGQAIDNFHQFSRIANWMLSKHREGDWFNAIETGPGGLLLEEGDVICASDDSGGLINVVTRIEDLRIHPNHDVTINQARKYSTQMFSDDVGTHSIPVASTLRFTQVVDSIVEFIDNYPIRDSDALTPGFYVAVSRDLNVSGEWRGWSLWADYGDGYIRIAQGDIAANLGTTTTTLGTVTDSSVWDRANPVTFTLDYQDGDQAPFASATEAELLSNPRRNLFLVGDEYLQAAVITDNGNRSYTISNLLRGRFGTDTPHDHLTHGASERVVFLNGAEQLVQIDPVRIGIPFNYKVVTTNQDVDDATPVSFTWTGGNMKTLAPTHLRGTRNSAGDLLIEWTRRDRLSSLLRDNAGTPLNEEKEIYIVEIYDGATLKRTIRDPRVEVVKSIAWTQFYDPDNGQSFYSDGSADINASADLGVALSNDIILGDFTLEFTRKGNNGGTDYRLGVVPSTINSYEQISGFGSEGFPYFLVDTSNNFAPMGNVTYQVSSAVDDKFTIKRAGTVVQFFKNAHSSSSPVPFYETTFTATPHLKAFFQSGFGVATYTIGPTSLSFGTKRAYNYTASQQVENFGSTQSSIKVRVYQESAIVGKGAYVEGLL